MDLAREPKMLLNMMMSVRPIVAVELGTITKSLEKRLGKPDYLQNTRKLPDYYTAKIKLNT